MSLVIVENGPQSFSIVDRAVPGGEDLEHQTSRARAEAALSRWQARRGGELRVVTTAGAENVSAAQQRREMLAATLKGKAAEVRRRVERVTSADTWRCWPSWRQTGWVGRRCSRPLRRRLRRWPEAEPPGSPQTTVSSLGVPTGGGWLLGGAGSGSSTGMAPAAIRWASATSRVGKALIIRTTAASSVSVPSLTDARVAVVKFTLHQAHRGRLWWSPQASRWRGPSPALPQAGRTAPDPLPGLRGPAPGSA